MKRVLAKVILVLTVVFIVVGMLVASYRVRGVNGLIGMTMIFGWCAALWWALIYGFKMP